MRARRSVRRRALRSPARRRADHRLDLGVSSRAIDDAAQVLDVGRLQRPTESVVEPFASSDDAPSRARATSTVRLPSIRSSPAGLPVTGVAVAPSRSSRSWKASPRGRPKRRAASRSGPARRARRRLQRPLDGVLRGLVAQHRHRRSTSARRGPGPRRRGTGRRSPRSGTGRTARGPERPGPGQPAPAEQLVGPAQQQVAEQDRSRGAVLLGCRASRCRDAAPPSPWAAGRPRRVSEASM